MLFSAIVNHYKTNFLSLQDHLCKMFATTYQIVKISLQKVNVVNKTVITLPQP